MVSKSGLALEALLRGPDDLLLLDEPDNSLDVPGKRWLEEQLRATDKGVLYVSHDRELLAQTATSIITLELGVAGNTAWTHPGGFDTYHRAREQRFERLDELRRRWGNLASSAFRCGCTVAVSYTHLTLPTNREV